MNKLSLMTAFALVIPLALGSCADKVVQAFDCAQICDRYADCFDANYDSSACAERCRDNAAADDDFADKASDCETCLDDRSCTSSFACAGECVGIVP